MHSVPKPDSDPMISSRLYLTVGKMSGWYFTLAGE